MKSNKQQIREYYYDSKMSIEMLVAIGFSKKEVLSAIKNV